MTDAPLIARGLRLGYGGSTIVDDLELEVPRGTFTMIVGANGCGKSTLLRGLARLLRAQAGAVLLDGHDIQTQEARSVARRLGILPQSPLAPEGLTVRDLVARGRYPHQRLLQQWSAEDEAAVARSLAATDLEGLAGRLVDELSGGQRQRAWIAMVLAQDTELILLDEPTTFLDLAHQVEVLELLDELVQEHGRTVVAVLHDLNQACRYADRLVALVGGRLHAVGAPADVVDDAFVRDVFGLEARVIDDPVTGTPLCLPIANRRRIRCET